MIFKNYIEDTYLRKEDPSGSNVDGLILEVVKSKTENSWNSFRNELKVNFEEVYDKMIQSEEFVTCSELRRHRMPYIVNDKDRIIQATTLKLEDGMRFIGKAYIYSIELVQSRQDSLERYKPTVKNACITETAYDHITFEPYREFVIRFDPSDTSNEGPEFRMKMISLLEEMLTIPQMYLKKPKIDVVIRGFFEKVEKKIPFSNEYELVSECDFTDISDPKTNQGRYKLIFYFEESDGTLKLNRFFLPCSLGKLFTKEFSEKQGTARFTFSEISDFLTKNKRTDVLVLNGFKQHAT